MSKEHGCRIDGIGFMSRPQIGAPPAWVAIPERIKELSDAISRCSEEYVITNNKNTVEHIRRWATEIIYHCDTLEKLQKLKENSYE